MVFFSVLLLFHGEYTIKPTPCVLTKIDYHGHQLHQTQTCSDYLLRSYIPEKSRTIQESRISIHSKTKYLSTATMMKIQQNFIVHLHVVGELS
jgi:hypothetical protein